MTVAAEPTTGTPASAADNEKMRRYTLQRAALALLCLSQFLGCASLDQASAARSCTPFTAQDSLWNRLQDGGSFRAAAETAGEGYCVDRTSHAGRALMDFAVWMEKQAFETGAYPDAARMSERLAVSLPEGAVIRHLSSEASERYAVRVSSAAGKECRLSPPEIGWPVCRGGQ